jgi:hypothetical protein
VQSLNGPWEFQRDGAKDWKTVQVPAPFQSHEGIGYHGVGWYRKRLPAFPVPNDKRVLLHIEAAATFTEVWWNGAKVGSHLGGWTPFRLDVTDQVRKQPGNQEIKIRVDEKVGHNTQGFLPVIAPHFGGIWQDVRLIIVPETYIDDLRLQAIGNPDTGKLELVVPCERLNAFRVREEVHVAYKLRGATYASKQPVRVEENDIQGKEIRVAVPVPGFERWSPENPSLYDVTIRLANDAVTTRAAFRKIEASGEQLLLNGKPLGVRGLLNWGYYPPGLAPLPDEDKIRKDIAFARSLGFNLMKFCLWVPPQRYLDWCDEMGVLAWMEYPTWHPQLTKTYLEQLTREFGEFFAYDRNHPCVILRSLTCETGSGAELSVLQGLYDLAHRSIPGSLIEDDSSWIGWNRVTDFYDDHPYGNNHTWVATLQKLKAYVRKHGPKPLVLGEAIAADTWTDREELVQRVSKDRPFWLPGFFDDQQRWLDQMRGGAGAQTLHRLIDDSRRYAMLMRKYQIETYRREVPHGGYVVSVIRDFPLAAMGLLDYLDRPKWKREQWTWHQATMAILKTEADRRTFGSGEILKGEVFISQQGAQAIEDGNLTVTVNNVAGGETRSLRLEQGTVIKALDLKVALPEVDRPTKFHVTTCLSAPLGGARQQTGDVPASADALPRGKRLNEGVCFRNEWPLWLMPKAGKSFDGEVAIHPSLPVELARQLFPGAARDKQPSGGTIVAARFDAPLLESLERGARVLLLPDGEAHSLPVRDHWFLRGGPFVAEHPLLQKVPRDLLVETQHFDLAGPVIPEIAYLDQIDPILMLWDNHDLKEVRTHGLLFETRVGQGRLLVSALRHDGRTNAVGRWLLDALLEHLANGPQPRHALNSETIARMREKLREQKVELVKLPWRFKPDPKGEGLRQGWQAADAHVDRDWKTIRVGQYWERQGYPDLDGWAWYRLTVRVPEAMKDRDIYLTFEGVDDYYELFVNGKLLGKGGDLEKRLDALEEHKSYRLTGLVKPGQDCLIAVRVNDFQGAGGIYRPVTLGTVPYVNKGEVLR